MRTTYAGAPVGTRFSFRELLTWRRGIGRVPPVVGNLLKKSFETLSKPTCTLWPSRR